MSATKRCKTNIRGFLCGRLVEDGEKRCLHCQGRVNVISRDGREPDTAFAIAMKKAQRVLR